MGKQARLMVNDSGLIGEIVTIISANVNQVKDIFTTNDGTKRISAIIGRGDYTFYVMEDSYEGKVITVVMTGEDTKCMEVLFAVEAVLGGSIVTDTDEDEAEP